jgi:hypothetical protein
LRTVKPLSDEERGLLLAQRLEQSVSGEPAVVVVFGACWMLASVIVQSLEQQGEDAALKGVTAISAQIGRCVAELLATRQATKQ